MTSELARQAGGAVIWRGLAMASEQLIFLLRLVILARLLTPEDFGLVAIGMIALGIAMGLTQFGIVPALIQDPARDRPHLDTAWTLSLVRGLLVCCGLLITAPWVAELFGEPAATNIIRALSLTALLQSVASIEVARLNRELHFKSLAAIRLSGAVANTVVSVALAFEFGVWALVIGALAGALTQTLASYIAAPYRPGLRYSQAAVARIGRFGRWMFLTGLLALAMDAALRWIVSTRLGVAELGLLFLAMRLAFLPAQLISDLVGEVAFPVYVRLRENSGKTGAAYRTLFTAVAALLLPTCLVFAWLVPDLIEHVLGERWRGAAGVMQLLILSTLIGMLGDSVIPILKARGRPAAITAMETLQLVVFVAVAWPLVGALGLVGAGFAWLGGIFASQLLAAYFARELFDNPFRGLGPTFAALAIAAVLATAAAAALDIALPGVAGLAAGVGVGATAAVVVTAVLDRRFELGILHSMLEPFPWLRKFAWAGPDTYRDER